MSKAIPRPAYKWVGGKGQIADTLADLAPKTFEMYFEPFTGGAAFFFKLLRDGRISAACLSDLNPQLMITLSQIRINVEEVISLLFHGKAPRELPGEEFCQLIGEAKYRAHLNYFYGITVEETLLLAVEEETRKEQRARALTEDNHLSKEVYERVYGAPMAELLTKFKIEKGYPKRNFMELGELKEFTYWLFKYRLNNCDKARIASDTKKALKELEHQWSQNKHRRDSNGEPTQA